MQYGGKTNPLKKKQKKVYMREEKKKGPGKVHEELSEEDSFLFFGSF